jgi:hypothetical protein
LAAALVNWPAVGTCVPDSASSYCRLIVSALAEALIDCRLGARVSAGGAGAGAGADEWLAAAAAPTAAEPLASTAELTDNAEGLRFRARRASIPDSGA